MGREGERERDGGRGGEGGGEGCCVEGETEAVLLHSNKALVVFIALIVVALSSDVLLDFVVKLERNAKEKGQTPKAFNSDKTPPLPPATIPTPYPLPSVPPPPVSMLL